MLIGSRTKPNACSSWRVFARRSALPLRKVMQLIGLGSGSKQDILGIPMWPSTQSHGNIFPPNATNCRQAPETAGQQASSPTPMAHFSMEADRQGLGAALCFNLWLGEQVIELGRADFHGRWITWVGNRSLKGLSQAG